DEESGGRIVPRPPSLTACAPSAAPNLKNSAKRPARRLTYELRTGMLSSGDRRRALLHFLSHHFLRRPGEDSRLIPARAQRRRLRKPPRSEFRTQSRQNARCRLPVSESFPARRSRHPPRSQSRLVAKKSALMKGLLILQPHPPVILSETFFVSRRISAISRALLIACILLLASLASAETLTGTVKNGPTGKPAGGDEVVLLSLGQGMEEAGRTK